MDQRTQKNQTVSTDDWYTPRWIIERLGPFDTDPCAAPGMVRPFHFVASMAWDKIKQNE